jgi:hypothetical protein
MWVNSIAAVILVRKFDLAVCGFGKSVLCKISYYNREAATYRFLE